MLSLKSSFDMINENLNDVGIGFGYEKPTS